MTFLAPQAIRSISAPSNLPSLGQASRAGMQFLGSVQRFSAGTLRPIARAHFEADPRAASVAERAGAERLAAGVARSGPPGSPAWLSEARSIAEDCDVYRFERFLQRIVAEEVYLRGVPAVEERRAAFERYLHAPLPVTTGTIELDSSVEAPPYYRGVEWHLQPGGWDGFDLYGPFFALVAGPHIFRHGGYAAVEAGDDIIEQRVSIVRQLRNPSPSRVYEAGCGGVSTLACVHRVFPDAELVGNDLSALLLQMGHATARRLGIPVHFKQRDCRETREPDASFDAVIMHALLHEMPTSAAVESIREAARILRKGGELVISDPPPFRAVDPFQAVLLDWDTENREEPFFSGACSADWSRELRAAGFTDVEEYALGARGYPWITRGRMADAKSA